MSVKSTFYAALAALSLVSPVFAGDMSVMVDDAYARSASPTAKTGAVFMAIVNHGAEDDRVIAAHSDIAKRVELHTHKDMGDGVMKMMEVEEGFSVPAGGTHMLARGGDHIMLMGLTRPLVQGETFPLTLTFEKAGDVTFDVPVDLERQPMKEMDHSGHSDMKKSGDS